MKSTPHLVGTGAAPRACLHCRWQSRRRHSRCRRQRVARQKNELRGLRLATGRYSKCGSRRPSCAGSARGKRESWRSCTGKAVRTQLLLSGGHGGCRTTCHRPHVEDQRNQQQQATEIAAEALARREQWVRTARMTTGTSGRVRAGANERRRDETRITELNGK